MHYFGIILASLWCNIFPMGRIKSVPRLMLYYICAHKLSQIKP